MSAIMEKDQTVNLLSEACFPLLESSKSNDSGEKRAPNKLPEKPLLQTESSNVPNHKNLPFSNKCVRPYNHNNNNITSVNSSHKYETYGRHEYRNPPEHLPMHEFMRDAGMGRGKNRAKFMSNADSAANKCDPSKVVCGSNSVDKHCTDGGDTSCSFVKKNGKPSDNAEVDVARDRLHQPENSSEKCTDTKTVPPNSSERFQRDADFRRLQNGIDSVNKGYKGKQFRISQLHNNMPPVQFKPFEKPLAKNFHMTPASTMLRTGKGRESIYRHDNRRNQTIKPHFTNDVDKIAYTKFRQNDKDIPYDGNRNLSRSYSLNKNEINSHMQSADTRPSIYSFRRRSFGNKNDHVHSLKHVPSNRFYIDISGAPMNNQGRTPVTSLKSDPYHYGNYFTGKGGHNAKFSHRTDMFGHISTNQIESPSYEDKSLSRSKTFSAGNRKPYVRNDSVETIDSEPPPTTSASFLSLSETSNSSEVLHQYSSNSEGVGVVSEEEIESVYSSHITENDTLSKQPGSSDFEDLCSPSSSSQASYADIMRAPLTKSPILHSPSITQKANESATASPDFLSKDGEQLGSSEWIIPRLASTNASANGVHINGSFQHQASTSLTDGPQQRPMAVNLEKPSFYNASLGSGKTVGSSLSSPEKKMLECQFVEEQLCNALVNKKNEKSNFFSELPATSPKERTISRTDFGFSDSSSVCSSTSSCTFKADAKCSAPPVIIMNGTVPLENVDISFGIEMDEIMKICSEQATSDVCFVPSSNLALHRPEKADRIPSPVMPSTTGLFLTVGSKKLLWKSDNVDVSKCNMRNIMDYLQETWNYVEEALGNEAEKSDKVMYYSSE